MNTFKRIRITERLLAGVFIAAFVAMALAASIAVGLLFVTKEIPAAEFYYIAKVVAVGSLSAGLLAALRPPQSY